MLRDKPEDAEVLAYCENLVKALCGIDRVWPARYGRFSTPRNQIGGRSAGNWVRRGAPLIVEGRATRRRRRPGHL